MTLTHIDEAGRPGMVDVGDKAVTSRAATARARVRLPPEVLSALDGDEIRAPKGAVLQTAVLAGTMGAKRTADLIPLCHPLPLSGVSFATRLREGILELECTARVEARTGVEMEALTGATVAALTVYDMCKALSTDIVIEEVRLVAKSGGKRELEIRP